jgi:DNA-binding transcriptional regulator YiaG
MAKAATKPASTPRNARRPARRTNGKHDVRAQANRPEDPIDGLRLRTRREALKLSQPQLGNLIDTPLNTISRWERGSILIDHPDWLNEQMNRLEAMATKRRVVKLPPIDAKRLKKRREALGLSEAELGVLLDTPASTVVRWEAGKINIGNGGWLNWKLSNFEAAAAARVSSDGHSAREL